MKFKHWTVFSHPSKVASRDVHPIKQRTRIRSAPSGNKDWSGSKTTGEEGRVKVTKSGTTMAEIPEEKYNGAKTAMTAQVIRHRPINSKDQVE